MFTSKRTILKVDMKTDVGNSREVNEDCFDFRIPQNEFELRTKGQLFAVADGMGGHAAGDVASRLALETFIDCYYSDSMSETVEANLENAACAANARVSEEARRNPEKKDMGSTLTSAVFLGDTMHVAHVGDSRAYLLRDGRLTQITRDHSWVGELYRRGALTEDEARNHPMGNIITRYMGRDGKFDADIYKERITPHDLVLLCSDGLSNALNAGQIRKILLRHGPSRACARLIALAKRLDGSDNISAIVIRVKRVEGESFPFWKTFRHVVGSRRFQIILLMCAVGMGFLLLAARNLRDIVARIPW
jgi:protein phosphatase